MNSRPDAAVPTGTCPCPLFWARRGAKATWPKGGAIAGTGRNLAIFTATYNPFIFYLIFKRYRSLVRVANKTLFIKKKAGSRNEAKNSRGVLSWRVMRASSLRAVSASIKASDKCAFVNL